MDIESNVDYLSDQTFRTWSVIVSKIIWGKTYEEISQKLKCHKSWAHGVIQKFEQNGRQVIDGRINNGGHTRKRTPEPEKVISDIYAENNRTTNKIMLNSIENQCGEIISERMLQDPKRNKVLLVHCQR